MVKEDILLYFNDINQAYNNASMYDSLSKLLDEYANEVRADGIDDYRNALHRQVSKNIEQFGFNNREMTNFDLEEIDTIAEQIKEKNERN